MERSFSGITGNQQHFWPRRHEDTKTRRHEDTKKNARYGLRHRLMERSFSGITGNQQYFSATKPRRHEEEGSIRGTRESWTPIGRVTGASRRASKPIDIE
jgi:hypothetical protein